MIKVNDVNVEIKGQLILKNINVFIPEGKVTCIIGPNGAGKSTFLKTLSKLVGYDGSILIDGYELAKTPTKVLSRLLFYIQPINVPQALNLTVIDTLMIAQYGVFTGFFDKKECFDRATKVAAELGFNHLLHRKIDELSSGELQRVVLAIGLVRQPRYMLFDEIDLHVDIGFKRKLVKLINGWKAEKTIVLTTHDLAFGTIVGEHFVFMNKGEVIYQGSIDGLISQREAIEEVFNIRVLTIDLNGKTLLIPTYI